MVVQFAVEDVILLHLADVTYPRPSISCARHQRRDRRTRGPGDLLGTAQSGLPALKIGNLKTDAALMRKARTAAVKIFELDPKLEAAENQRFRELIVEQQGRTFSQVS